MPRMLVLVGAVLILTALTQIGGAALLIAIAAALLLRFGKLGACPSNSRFFCWRGKRESDSVLSHEQDIPRLED